MTDNKLTDERLMQRLCQFEGAYKEACAMQDDDFASECADIAAALREVLAGRAGIAPGATFIDIPMLPRSGVTSTAISILSAERRAGKNAFIVTTSDHGRWLSQSRGLFPAWIARLGDMNTLSRASVIVVDDADAMEAKFARIYPRAGGLRAHLAALSNVRVYWLTSRE